MIGIGTTDAWRYGNTFATSSVTPFIARRAAKRARVRQDSDVIGEGHKGTNGLLRYLARCMLCDS